ncbi:hypothetical protein RFI_08113 [Reticulomyxa filosa]|uniref:Uncharacterized protein n=1 Tax=Reticulomyxa filosa TaxID=46433 RepID=X6NSU5_RETFI|nr:hypothetical protein RFI_08113 [Reticulomyxa filosa]|eukprot:ETO29013.1 hypothetical protein RFI_08113 [Reticulomyxa filosa]
MYIVLLLSYIGLLLNEKAVESRIQKPENIDDPKSLLLNKYRKQFLDVLAVWRGRGEHVVLLPSEPTTNRTLNKHATTYRKLNMGPNNWISGLYAYLFGVLDMCRQYGFEFVEHLNEIVLKMSDRYIHRQLPLHLLHFLLIELSQQQSKR